MQALAAYMPMQILSYESQLPNVNSAQTTFKQKIKQSLGTSLFQQTLQVRQSLSMVNQ
jgi:hypothetical protein